MSKAHRLKCGTALCCLLFAASAGAQPGDAAAIAQARKDYGDALKSHDIGLRNAMRAELAAQLAMARQNATREHARQTSGVPASRPAPRK